MEIDNKINYENEHEPRTPEEILRTTATEFSALYKRARDALWQDKDTATFQLLLRDRARLLVFLPLKLQQAVERGESFSGKAMDKIRGFAADATDMLATDNMFGLGSLLTRRDSDIDDPNDLERLINKLYPPKQPLIDPQK